MSNYKVARDLTNCCSVIYYPDSRVLDFILCLLVNINILLFSRDFIRFSGFAINPIITIFTYVPAYGNFIKIFQLYKLLF